MTTNIRPTLAIIYGFAEGPRISKRLRQALGQAGFDVIGDAEKADIIVAHSGGVCYLPQDLEGKTVLIVAPTYWRKGKPLVRAALNKIQKEARIAFRNRHFLPWFVKSYFNTLSAWGHLSTSIRMYKAVKGAGLTMPLHDARRVGVISYHGDSWSGFIDQIKVDDYPNYCLISSKRSHDDLWLHPKDYVAVIQYLYES
jgi:hypothetical protein